jgi:hypothetical protein
MARKKIREYDSKRLLREHLKRLAGIDLQILSAQVGHSLPSPLFPLLLALLRCGAVRAHRIALSSVGRVGGGSGR